MSKRKGSNRARRARKDWTKGNRERVSRMSTSEGEDSHHDSVAAGHERMRPRAITIDDGGNAESLPKGEVFRTQSGVYGVRLPENGQTLSCRVKRGASTENDDATLVTIGDIVRVQPLEDDHGLIHHVEARNTLIGRSGTGRRQGGRQVIAANPDQILCVTSAEREDFRLTVIDRFIVGALLGEVTPIIVVNKMDTTDEEFADALRDGLALYTELGYTVVFISAKSGEGIEELRAICRDKTSALVGQSGVGKSTIANAMLGRDVRETGEVRETDRRGRHTTVGSEILDLPGGGRLIDTPGLREFGIWDLEPQELDGYFVEFLDYLQDCKYLPCTHTHEPGCAVIGAVDEGLIDEGRYASYLAILDTLEER